MRTEIEQLRQYEKQTKVILEALASDNQSYDILAQLRNGIGLEDISKTLNSSSSASSFKQEGLDTPNEATSSGASVSNPSNVHHSLQSIRGRYSSGSLQSSSQSARNFGQQLILGDEINDTTPLSHHGPVRHDQSWTAVTTDGELVEHLLALYFCWEYPIFATVSKEHFMEDFRKGHERYCSSLLVNALLALACRFSDRPEAVLDLDEHTSAGDVFFAEALELYRSEEDRHNLTTIQALGVMSIREASCGRINESSFLSTQSIRLAIEMGLHGSSDDEEDRDEEEDDVEDSVRRATFWGAYSLNE